MTCRSLSRVLTELVSKMRDMRMDKTELGCLRAIILFNPGKRRSSHLKTKATLEPPLLQRLLSYPAIPSVRLCPEISQMTKNIPYPLMHSPPDPPPQTQRALLA